MTIVKKTLLFSFFSLFLLSSFVTAATAQDRKTHPPAEWEFHQSVTNSFDVKFPQKYKYNIFPFMYNPGKIAFSTQILSTLDGGPTDQDKSILVKSVQTFGAALTQRQVQKILERDVLKYKAAARGFGGEILANEDFIHKGFNGKNIYITYQKNNQKYGIRIRLYVTDYTKIEQVLTGQATTMYSFRADDFFDSLMPREGIMSYNGDDPIGTGWIAYSSPRNLFTSFLPPKNADYTPSLPAFHTEKQRGAMRFEIVDPVLRESAYYNIYSYKLSKAVSYNRAKSLLFSNHVSRFVSNASINSLETDNSVGDNDVNVMKTRLVITPITRYPHVSVITYEVNYVGDTIIIKEFLSNTSHSLSGLHNTLFNLTMFHPEKYKPSQN